MNRYRCVMLAGIDSLLEREGLLRLLPVTSICVEARDEDEAGELAAKALGLPDNHIFATIVRD